MSKVNIKKLPSYRSHIKKHMSAYIAQNYEAKNHIKANKIGIRSSEPEEVLLKSNREIYKQYIKNYPWKSIGNMLSSQGITLDYFLPYFNEISKLSESLGQDTQITSMTFKACIYDDTHIDVLLQDANQDKIIIKVGFTENNFSKKHITAAKLEIFGRYYYRINHLMTKNFVTAEGFCEHETLFRYILNTFLNINGEKGTLILLYPKKNDKLHQSSQAFYHKLKNYYGFKYIDRIKLMHFENMPLNQAFINKYLNIKTKALILSVNQKNGSNLLVTSEEDVKTMTRKLNEVETLDVKIIENVNRNKGLFSKTLATLEDYYDLYSIEDAIDKRYFEYKHVNIDLEMDK